MTLLHVTNQLVGFFCKEHIFTKEDFSLINVDSTMEECRDSFILTSLHELSEIGFIKKLVDKDIWIIVMPPGSNGSEVKLSMFTCNIIADTINTFYKANDIDADHVDSLAINEQHILTIIEIMNDLLNDDDGDDKE